MKVVWLTGDYTGKKERQKQAERARCDVVIEFHFNASDNANASGAEVWYRMYSLLSKRLAEILLDKIASCGLKRRGTKAAVSATRSAFINAYPNTAYVVLLEPAFVTNRSDAARLHDPEFIAKLAEAIASGIREFALETQKTKRINVIGLSVGHIGKTSNPRDKGARCVFGDFEADHASALAEQVAKLLQS